MQLIAKLDKDDTLQTYLDNKDIVDHDTIHLDILRQLCFDDICHIKHTKNVSYILGLKYFDRIKEYKEFQKFDISKFLHDVSMYNMFDSKKNNDFIDCTNISNILPDKITEDEYNAIKRLKLPYTSYAQIFEKIKKYVLLDGISHPLIDLLDLSDVHEYCEKISYPYNLYSLLLNKKQGSNEYDLSFFRKRKHDLKMQDIDNISRCIINYSHLNINNKIKILNEIYGFDVYPFIRQQRFIKNISNWRYLHDNLTFKIYQYENTPMIEKQVQYWKQFNELMKSHIETIIEHRTGRKYKIDGVLIYKPYKIDDIYWVKDPEDKNKYADDGYFENGKIKKNLLNYINLQYTSKQTRNKKFESLIGDYCKKEFKKEKLLFDLR